MVRMRSNRPYVPNAGVQDIAGGVLRTLGRRLAVLTGQALMVLITCRPAVAAAQNTIPRDAVGAIVLENEFCRYEIGLDGKNRALVNRVDKQDYAQPGVPFMIAGQGQQSFAASKVERTGNVLHGVLCRIPFEGESQSRGPGEVLHAYGDGCFGWGPRVAPILQSPCENERERGGTSERGLGRTVCGLRWLVMIAPIADRTACPPPGRTASSASKGPRSPFSACPPAVWIRRKLLNAIEVVELEQGLPHPTVHGVWIKRAPERFASYLMVGGVNQQNIDQVIEFIEAASVASKSSGSGARLLTSPIRVGFPMGCPGLKRVADKVHAAGLQLGLHVMQGMVGWGSKDDPYITPEADPRLLQDRHATLAAPLDAKSTAIRIHEPTAGWPEKGDLYLEGEIIQYGKLAGDGFSECRRGLYGTKVIAIRRGSL